MGADEIQVRRGRTQRRANIEVDDVPGETEASSDEDITTIDSTSTPVPTSLPLSTTASTKPVTIPIESALLPATAIIASSASSSPTTTSTPTPTPLTHLPEIDPGFQEAPTAVGTSGPSPLTLLGIGVGLTLAISLVILIYLIRRCHKRRVVRRSRQITTPITRGNRQSIWGQTDNSAAPTPRTSFQYNAYIPPMVQKTPSSTEIFFKAETEVTRPVRLFSRRESVQSPPSPLPLERRPSTGGVMNSKIFIRPLPQNEIGAARTSALWVNPKLPVPVSLPPQENLQTPLNADGFRFPVSTSPAQLDKDQTSSFAVLSHFSFSTPTATSPPSPVSAVDPKDCPFSDLDATETTSTLGDGWANPSFTHNSVGFAANLSAPSPYQKTVTPSPLKTELLSLALFIVPLQEEEDIEIPETLTRWTDPLTWAKDQSRRNASRSEQGGQGPPCDAV